ncbi:hypothetical protein A2765_01550 [Candidatus Kaiserbacteria bacterium RIFCSPHIGHO2_01_FULL_56_24]|uniref:Uncharacterized protein n=1 Tax=Candidatus Kaiserbacteria bacterium RIFCSPHIGHO2_01_FULL_56_24 TaxID=1798487 RepID=A0A1F6DH39_9BACT|nr:MAG: hypothetical protein A2765_01550 [Candidatus Kaiserbacteria bacterium RIFCSPHIGHO2_01_FULL_56_24]
METRTSACIPTVHFRSEGIGPFSPPPAQAIPLIGDYEVISCTAHEGRAGWWYARMQQRYDGSYEEGDVRVISMIAFRPSVVVHLIRCREGNLSYLEAR